MAHQGIVQIEWMRGGQFEYGIGKLLGIPHRMHLGQPLLEVFFFLVGSLVSQGCDVGAARL